MMAWPYVELGELISHRKEFIEISPDVTYARCRVQTSARGIVLRDRVAGSEIKTKKQQVCRTAELWRSGQRSISVPSAIQTDLPNDAGYRVQKIT